MDNEDEDVVFEGSELHKHLENIGMDSTDYLCMIRSDKSFKAENELNSNISNENSRCTITLIQGLQNPFNNKSTSRLELSCCETYLQNVVQSEVLTQDDATFLENYLQSNGKKEHLTEFPLQRDFYKLMAATVILLAVIYSNYKHFQTILDILSIRCIIMTLLATYTINELRKDWNYYTTKMIHKKNQECLNALLENCSTLMKLLQKCILTIQEFELIDRGFTLLLPQITFRSTDSPLKSSRHHCPGLRQLIFVSSKKIALTFREATTKLRNNIVLNSGIDHESHYLSSVPVAEFGFHFSDDIEDFDVDPLSLSALKSTWQLTCMQISEYFRRLCLSFHVELHDKNAIQMNIFRSLTELLVPLDQNVSSVLVLLQQSYQFHKNAMIIGTNENEKFNKDRISNQSNFKGVKIAVHSLLLHLQSALSRTLDIEKELENEDILDSTITKKTETYEMLSHLLQSVKLELNSCQTCEDESQSQIDILFNKNPEVPKFRSLSENLEDALLVNKNNPIPLFEMGDPISEDQIFEAYISDNESQISDTDDDYFVQRDEIKKKKETTKLMLSELQTILTVRADDWRKRERKALAKAKGIDVDSLTSTDEDDDVQMANCNGEIITNKTSNYEEVTQIFKMEKNENNIFELENCEDPSTELSDDIRKEIKRRLQDYSHAPQLDFTASVAALAASRSRQMNCIASEVLFSDSEIEENCSDSNN